MVWRRAAPPGARGWLCAESTRRLIFGSILSSFCTDGDRTVGYGYRDFSNTRAQWRLLRWLYALCWTGTDLSGTLFDQATAWLVPHKVLLPGASLPERAIARVRVRANSRLWRLPAARITADQKERLDA